MGLFVIEIDIDVITGSRRRLLVSSHQNEFFDFQLSGLDFEMQTSCGPPRAFIVATNTSRGSIALAVSSDLYFRSTHAWRKKPLSTSLGG